MIKLTDPRVTLWPVDKIVEDPENLKQHPEVQVQQIMASIKRFGFLDPIALSSRGIIIEGHGRFTAARRLGMTVVPCFVLAHLNDDERKAYAISHNQTTLLSPMANGIVYEEFERLGVTSEDWQALGYTADDVLAILPEEGRGKPEKGWVPPAPRVIASVVEFEDERQALMWGEFLARLRALYTSEHTIAERLCRFVDHYSGEIGGTNG